MMPMIRIQAIDGSGGFAAYHAPATGPHAGASVGAVVLIQEIFGVSASLREIADQVASLGYHVLAPDLFWRQEPGVDLSDKTQAEWDRAFALMGGFDQAKGVEDLTATLAVARTLPGCNGRAATMGYCLGGRLAAMMATRSDADANISYYGVGLDSLIPELGRVTKPLLLHVADKDEFFPAEGRQKLLKAVAGHAKISAHVYPNADHAFARAGGTHWDGRSAWIANGLSAQTLVAALG
jgi:carboxymethylenebutenolidase